MQALERIVGTTTWLGSIGALGGVALLLIAGSLFARMRRFLAGESASPGQPRDKGAAALEMIASLAAAVGVLGTFFALLSPPQERLLFHFTIFKRPPYLSAPSKRVSGSCLP